MPHHFSLWIAELLQGETLSLCAMAAFWNILRQPETLHAEERDGTIYFIKKKSRHGSSPDEEDPFDLLELAEEIENQEFMETPDFDFDIPVPPPGRRRKNVVYKPKRIVVDLTCDESSSDDDELPPLFPLKNGRVAMKNSSHI